MRRFLSPKLIAAGIVLLVAALIGVALLQSSPPASGVDITQIIHRIQSGQVTKVVVQPDGRTANVTFNDKTESTVVLPQGQSFTTFLTDAQIPASEWPPIQIEHQSSWSANSTVFIRILTIVGIGFFLFLMFRRFSPGSMGSNNSRKGAFEPICRLLQKKALPI